jgi:hypothetical protein
MHSRAPCWYYFCSEIYSACLQQADLIAAGKAKEEKAKAEIEAKLAAERAAADAAAKTAADLETARGNLGTIFTQCVIC